MASWHSLFLPFADSARIADTLRSAHGALGYTPFNPFAAIPGAAYSRAVRLFVAPARGGWTRVIGAPDAEAMPALSPCLWLALEDGQAAITTYIDGKQTDPETALVPHLRQDRTPDDLRRALHGQVPTAAAPSPELGGVPLDALPDEVRALSAGVNLRQAGGLFSRMVGTLSKKVGGDEAARALLQGDDWSSEGGRLLTALVACLTIPADWREPSFVAVRDAYQLHERRQRRPNADLYPGDAEAMAAVPDALDYMPVYLGKQTG